MKSIALIVKVTWRTKCSALLTEHHYAFTNAIETELTDSKRSLQLSLSNARQLLDQNSETQSILDNVGFSTQQP